MELKNDIEILVGQGVLSYGSKQLKYYDGYSYVAVTSPTFMTSDEVVHH